MEYITLKSSNLQHNTAWNENKFTLKNMKISTATQHVCAATTMRCKNVQQVKIHDILYKVTKRPQGGFGRWKTREPSVRLCKPAVG